VSALRVIRCLRYPVLSWRARQLAVASAAPAAVEVPEAGDVLVPRVTVQLVTRDKRTWVEAVAEISDGLVTARGVQETSTTWWDREYGTRTYNVQGLAQSVTQSAIAEARRLLAGAQAGHAAEAERTAEAERAAAAAARPAESDAAVQGASGVAR
jgi:hypothetical protein